MLELNRVTVEARLKAVSLKLPSTGLIGVIGANGAGKSTLLKAIAGQLHDFTGEICWQDKLLTQFTPRQRRQLLSWLPQSPTIVGRLTVLEILKIGAVNLDLSSQQRQQRIATVVRDFELTLLTQRCYQELSGGEQRRVHLAVCFLNEAPLMLLDEPTSGLDIGHALKLLQDLRSKASQDHLILVAIHDLALAAQFCDQIVLLDEGHLISFGTPNEAMQNQHISSCFEIELEWFCTDNGVAILPFTKPKI